MDATDKQFDDIDYLPPKNPKRVYTRLTPAAAKLLVYYLGLCRLGQPPRFRVSLKTISKATGVPRRTVMSANECLRQMNIMDWHRGHGFGGNSWTNDYWFNWPMILQMRDWVRQRTGK